MIKYVPILKSKQGEFIALRELKADTKSCIIPLVEIIPIQLDYSNAVPKKTLEAHTADIIRNLAKSWVPTLPIYIDTLLLKGGSEGIFYVYDQLDKCGLNYIPVINIEEHQKSIDILKSVVERTRNGFCLRLSNGFITNTNLRNEVLGIIELYDVGIGNIDLLIDLGDISIAALDFYKFAIEMQVNMVDIFSQFRRVIIAAGSIPPDLSEFSSGTENFLPRKEWDFWKAITLNPKAKNFLYSDYGTNNKALNETDPRMMRIGAAIRYTLEDKFYILKGYAINNPAYDGFGQFHELSNRLRKSDLFSGSSFSWGDNYIYFCGQRLNGPGNKATWVAISANHHIELVNAQLSNRPVF
jgi:hypothetical protein